MASQAAPQIDHPSAGIHSSISNFSELKLHSASLTNQRLAWWFFILDEKSIQLNCSYDVFKMMEVKAVLHQIYKNVRTLIRNNPTMRATLNLETKQEGIYTTDVMFDQVEKMVQYCEQFGYSTKRIYIMIGELNSIELILKDILQYYHYFFRPEFRQKPDIEVATEKYKAIADKRTVEELKKLIGRGHMIDFDTLGAGKIDLKDKDIDYDEAVDGELSEEDKAYIAENEKEDL